MFLVVVACVSVSEERNTWRTLDPFQPLRISEVLVLGFNPLTQAAFASLLWDYRGDHASSDAGGLVNERLRPSVWALRRYLSAEWLVRSDHSIFRGFFTKLNTRSREDLSG